MTLWQNLQPLIHPLLLALYPELNDETQPESSHEQGQQLRYQLLQQFFTDLNEHNESEQTEAFVQACLLNDISYTPIYSDLMALARSVLGSLVNGQNCQEVMALNQSFDRIEKQVSQAYFQQYLRKLAVKNHIRLSHLANLSEKNLLVHYQNHLQWMLQLINQLEGIDIQPSIEHDHNRCSFGRWLHGQIIPMLKSSSHFKEVERLHIKLHKLGKAVLTQQNSGHNHPKQLIHLMNRLDYISLEIGAEIAILNDMMMITEYHKDPLTGVLTRHLLDKILSAQIEIAKATESTCALLMMDLDNFKHINDQYGHLTGDAVIQNFTDILKRCLRKSDFIFRFGGEEFLVLVPSTNSDEVQQIAQKILHEVRQQSLATSTTESLVNYTVSIGTTTIEPSNLSFVTKEVVNHYIGEADARLYLAKRNGRNRVE
jgi:diguanylate cyclase (GGDEF)-like protein